MQKATKRKLLLVLMSALCFMPHAQGQEGRKENIEWSKDRPLKWQDFPFIKLKTPGKELALTSVKHSVTGRMNHGKPDFEVKVIFVTQDSWTTDTTNMRLLAHEQLHFDIGELFRRKIEQKVKRLRGSGEKQRAIYRYAIRKLLSDFRNFSVEYDKETDHGNKYEEQLKWESKVWEELNRLQ